MRCTIFEYDRYCDKFFAAIGVTEDMAALGVNNMADLMDKADVIVPIYEKAFIKKSSAEWLKIFAELDIVSGRLFHFADVLKDEQAWANQYLQTYKCGNGVERVLPTCPVRLGSQGALKLGAPILYGEHNRQVLAQLGYSEAEIDAIIAKGALS